MALLFRLQDEAGGDWASFVPVIGGWSDERLSLSVGDVGPGVVLHATARPVNVEGAPAGPGVFALRWFECEAADAEEFVELSASAWPAFEAATPGTQIFGLFRAVEVPAGAARFLLCTRYPSLSAWESSRADTRSPQFRRRAELTRRTKVSVWRLA